MTMQELIFIASSYAEQKEMEYLESLDEDSYLDQAEQNAAYDVYNEAYRAKLNELTNEK